MKELSDFYIASYFFKVFLNKCSGTHRINCLNQLSAPSKGLKHVKVKKESVIVLELSAKKKCCSASIKSSNRKCISASITC